ncbi:MAG TPA: acyltransferase family protein [Chitinophagaceae bacterium]|nr:acyltransferase family protein [Chitinophagaceae bacterium]
MDFFFFVLLLTIITRFVVWTYKIEDLAYFNLYTFSRIDGICLGSMLALLRSWNEMLIKQHTTLIVFSLAAFNFIFYFFNLRYNFSFPYLAIAGYTTFAVLISLLVNKAVTRDNKIIDAIFNWPLLKFFGRISYSLYVFHWPLHLMLFPILLTGINKYIQAPVPASVCTSLLTTFIGFLISVISYQYFEKIFLKLKIKFT